MTLTNYDIAQDCVPAPQQEFFSTGGGNDNLIEIGYCRCFFNDVGMLLTSKYANPHALPQIEWIESEDGRKVVADVVTVVTSDLIFTYDGEPFTPIEGDEISIDGGLNWRKVISPCQIDAHQAGTDENTFIKIVMEPKWPFTIEMSSSDETVWDEFEDCEGVITIRSSGNSVVIGFDTEVTDGVRIIRPSSQVIERILFTPEHDLCKKATYFRRAAKAYSRWHLLVFTERGHGGMKVFWLKADDLKCLDQLLPVLPEEGDEIAVVDDDTLYRYRVSPRIQLPSGYGCFVFEGETQDVIKVTAVYESQRRLSKSELERIRSADDGGRPFLVPTE